MSEAIRVHHIDLKCDACGAIEGAYQLSEIGDHMIGRPCPACGADLLTKQDMDAMHKMMGLKDLLNAVLGPIDKSRPIHTEIIAVNPHGNTLTIERRPSPKETGK